MPKLFVANLSKQHHIFSFRMHERDSVRVQEIQVGNQVLVAQKDLDNDEINYIIGQHTRYGLKRFEDMKSLKGYAGICYRIDKAVPLDGFLETYETNAEVLNQRSQDRLVLATEAISDVLGDATRGLGTPLARTAVEQVEEPTNGGQARIATGVEVLSEGKEARNAGRTLSRKRA